jgi:hypothetical protein
MTKEKRWVLLENGEPHIVLLTNKEIIDLLVKLRLENPLKNYTTFYDEYYEYIDYYSEEEKEQINRLIP